MTETPVKANKSRKLALMLAIEFCDKHADVITVASEFLAFLEPDQFRMSRPPSSSAPVSVKN